MNFRGQPHIMRQLGALLPELYTHMNSCGETFLFRGPSGYGKTRIALLTANYLSGRNFQMCLGNGFTFNPDIWVHLIDEVHLLSPPEILYPIIDSRKYIIIMTTNDIAELAEPLVNRSIDLIFNNYSAEDLRIIISESTSLSLPNQYLDYIIKCGSGNPRICLGLIRRLEAMLRSGGDISTIDKFTAYIENMMGIKDGMDTLVQRYVNVLESLGGTASIDTLAVMLHVDKATLRSQVEPALMYRNLIRISSKGRMLC